MEVKTGCFHESDPKIMEGSTVESRPWTPYTEEVTHKCAAVWEIGGTVLDNWWCREEKQLGSISYEQDWSLNIHAERPVA